jgi:protein-S-isoprenylcysteine O-methyltransferase Ste14
MIWLPPLVIFAVFVVRVIELNYPFPATKGRVEAKHTYTSLTLIGGLTVAASIWEYLAFRPTPNWLLMGIGLAAAAAAFALRAAARKALGLMWSVHVEIREKHILVQTGPYRFVRHPIYVAAILELAAIPLTLGTWRTGIFCLVTYVVALALRVAAEERAMRTQLGPAWSEYCKSTGAFVPRW